MVLGAKVGIWEKVAVVDVTDVQQSDLIRPGMKAAEKK